jgi:hypothetical protein
MAGFLGNQPPKVPMTSADIVDGTVTANDLNSTLNLSSKTVTLPASSVTSHVTSFDDSDIRSDILKLALHQAIDGNRVAYNLEDSFVDGFEDSSGITTLTNAFRNTSNEYCSSREVGPSDYTSDSYSSGDRTSLITVTRSSSPELFSSSYLPSTNNMFVDGVTSGVAYIGPSAVGGWLKFDFGAGVTKLVTGLQWYLSQGLSHDFRLDGSNDDLNWTTIGASIDIGTGSQMPAEKWTGLTHTTEYRYYRLYQTAGGSSSGGDLREINFKIPASIVNATGTLISDPQTASTSRTSCSGVIIYEDADGTNTLGTDLKIYFSCDNSAWTEASSYGTATTYSGSKKLVKLGATTCTAGTSVAMKAVWANQATSTDGQIAGGTGTAIGTFTNGGGLAALFDGNTAQSYSAGGLAVGSGTGWAGKSWGSVKTITKVIVYPWSSGYFGGNNPTNMTITIEGSTDAAFTSPVVLETKTGLSGTTAGTQTFTSLITTTGYAHHRVRFSNGAGNASISEVEFFEAPVTGKEARLHGWAVNY